MWYFAIFYGKNKQIKTAPKSLKTAFWCGFCYGAEEGLEPRPTDYESVALPTALLQHLIFGCSAVIKQKYRTQKLHKNIHTNFRYMIIHQKFKDFNTKFEKEVFKNRKRSIKVLRINNNRCRYNSWKIIYEYNNAQKSCWFLFSEVLSHLWNILFKSIIIESQCAKRKYFYVIGCAEDAQKKVQ